MARGGYRIGAGRPKGQASVKIDKKDIKTIKKSAKLSKKSPLEYMLDVMNDESVEENRRDKMAIAAAPYVHERAIDKKLGKKEQKKENAKTAVNIFTQRRTRPKLAINNS
ncbi:hypothetical protein ME5_00051 [Bartonella tamiae Th239]|uniref:Uncharacterized protein n=2 Tax=Bartonella tamiae TaxID=373638 RepID=J1K2G1_9HYPH|nr:hypothetical protein ME5_00051 [Bartonella tamiae Th239]